MLAKIIKLESFCFSQGVIIKNCFSGNVLAQYSQTSLDDLITMTKRSQIDRKAWLKKSELEKAKSVHQFFLAVTNQQSSNKLVHLLSSLTGKQLHECQSQLEISSQILQSQLHHVHHKFQPNRDYFSLHPLSNIVAIFDHRNPILNSFKYLGYSLLTGNNLFLRPSLQCLPLTEHFCKLWKEISGFELINSLVDIYNPAHEDSPLTYLKNISEVGFVSYAGRIQEGRNYHYSLASTSQNFPESQFLLNSSDSAYISKMLTSEEMKVAAQKIARGIFSNAGGNFNSIKRVYVDRQVGEKFVELLSHLASFYQVKIEGNQPFQVNNGTLGIILKKTQFEQTLEKMELIQKAEKDNLKLVMGGKGHSVSSGVDHTYYFIQPTIFVYQSQLLNYPAQNQELLGPICFVQLVDSLEQCIQKVNSSIMGNTFTLFSHLTGEEVERVGEAIDVGAVNANTWEMTNGLTYSGRKRSGKGFSFSHLSVNNIVRSKAISFSDLH